MAFENEWDCSCVSQAEMNVKPWTGSEKNPKPYRIHTNAHAVLWQKYPMNSHFQGKDQLEIPWQIMVKV